MTNLKTVDSTNTIYIPIWLDLLLMYIKPETIYGGHLHSNMVRFII